MEPVTRLVTSLENVYHGADAVLVVHDVLYGRKLVVGRLGDAVRSGQVPDLLAAEGTEDMKEKIFVGLCKRDGVENFFQFHVFIPFLTIPRIVSASCLVMGFLCFFTSVLPFTFVSLLSVCNEQYPSRARRGSRATNGHRAGTKHRFFRVPSW